MKIPEYIIYNFRDSQRIYQYEGYFNSKAYYGSSDHGHDGKHFYYYTLNTPPNYLIGGNIVINEK